MKKRNVIASLFSLTVIVTVMTVSIPAVMLSCEAETAGRSIRFQTAAQGAVDSGEELNDFETAKGWRVELTRALALLGPVYFYGGEPMASRRLILPGAGVAMACPTHAQYDYGAVLGEVLDQYVIDLLADKPTSTGEVDGQAGTCQSVEVHLHPQGDQGLRLASGADAVALLEGYSIRLEGTAEKDGETVPFRALVTIPDEGTARIVQNIAGNVVLDDVSDKPGRLVVQALLDIWLTEVDFSTLTETDEDGAFLFTEGTQAWTALVQAVRNRYAYRVVWSNK